MAKTDDLNVLYALLGVGEVAKDAVKKTIDKIKSRNAEEKKTDNIRTVDKNKTDSDTKDLTVCPVCGAKFESHVKACPICGAVIAEFLSSTEAMAKSGDENKVCPVCEARLPINSNMCPICGADLSDIGETDTDQGYIYCHNCDTELDPGTKVCPICGADLLN